MPAEPPSAGSHGRAAAERRRDECRAVLLLATLIAFQPLSTDLYLPSMTSIAAGLGLGAGTVQATLSVYIVGFAFTQLLAGPLPDRFGRRPVVLAGLFACVAGSVVAMTAFALGAAVLCVRGLRETTLEPAHDAMRPGPMVANDASVLRSRTWLGFTLIGTAMYWGLLSFLSEASFVFGGVDGLSPAAFGFAFAAVTTGFLLGTLSVRRVLPRLGVQRTIGVATGLAAVAGCTVLALALARVDPIAAVIGPQCLFVFGHGLSQSAWQAGSVAPFPRHTGAAAAMTGFVQNVVAACAGALIGRLHDGSALPMAGMVAAAGMAAAVVAQTLVRRHGGMDAGPLPAAAR
jgi:predicted MFS family arabinose efflux permease